MVGEHVDHSAGCLPHGFCAPIGDACAVVPADAACFALIASSRILSPSCEAVTEFASETFQSSGLWNDAPLAAVHHSQFACASPCFPRADLSASSGTPSCCACTKRPTSCESQNSALRTLP